MTNTPDLRKQLVIFTEKVEKVQSMRRKTRLERAHQHEKMAEGQIMQGLRFSPDITSLLGGLRQHIAYEKNRYTVPQPLITAGPEAPAAATPPEIAAPPTAFTQELSSNLALWLKPATHPDVPETLTPPVTRYATLLMDELSGLTNETALLGSSGATIMPRLKQAQHAIFSNRMQDALTILRSAYKNNPHSHLLLYLLSQFLYLLHALGQQGSLPEARELAQKSIIATDKIGPERLLRYRFHAIVTELGHDPERALAWLRDTALLNVGHLAGPKGWLADETVPLRAWAILAEIPINLWGEREFSQLHALAQNVAGGGLLYLFFFRTALTAEAATRKIPLPLVVQLEKLVQSAFVLYGDIAGPLAQLLATPVSQFWTIRTRFAITVANVCPLPMFDHVLLHIGLDGRAVATGFPDAYLRNALDDPHTSYWRLWTGCLSPDRENRQSHLLPAAETVEDKELLEQMGVLQTALRALEQKLIRHNIWPDLLPWMPRWQLDHLLALGTGSNRPRTRFAPTLPPYSTYYRRWSEPTPSAVLPSEMIAENAKRGGFASLFEVQAAFEGSLRMLTDPVHGLLPTQKRALEAAQKANPAKFGGAGFEMGGGPVGKMLVLGGLLAAGVMAAVHLSENMGQAIGISLVVAGFVGMLAVQLAKPSKA